MVVLFVEEDGYRCNILKLIIVEIYASERLDVGAGYGLN